MHADPRAAVEAVLGPIDDLRPAGDPRRPRPLTLPGSMDVVSQSVLDQLFGPKNPDITGFRPFGRLAVDGQDQQ